MFCTNCGSEIKEGEIYCSKCGANNSLNTEVNTEENRKEVDRLKKLNPRKGVYMERMEKIQDKTPQYLIWTLVAIASGLIIVIPVLLEDSSDWLGLIVGACIFSMMIEVIILSIRIKWLKGMLRQMRLYQPVSTTNEEVFHILLRVCEGYNMQVILDKYDRPSVTYNGVIYDVLLNNEKGTFQLWWRVSVGKSFLSAFTFDTKKYKRYIDGMGKIAYLIQHGLMGEL